MKAEFQIQTISNSGLAAIFGDNPNVGSSIREADGLGTLTLSSRPGRGFGLGEVVTVVLEWAPGALASIPTGLLGSWLYDVLKDKVRTVRVGDSRYQITPDHIARLVRTLEQQSGTGIAAADQEAEK